MNKYLSDLDQLSASLGQASCKGRKTVNQDFHGALVPDGRALSLKGITVALADGISTSEVSHVAAETAVKSLLTDYYATPDSWAAQTGISTVINATNSWLHAQTTGTTSGDVDRGYVCTIAALVLKARQAHLFHVGDSRIWRVSGASLEPLTQDHQSMGMLSAALGARQTIEITYKSVTLAPGDIFILTTDGVHEFWAPSDVIARIAEGDLQTAAEDTLSAALEAGSPDNMTVQIVRIDALPTGHNGINSDALTLPFPSIPNAGDILDGYEILRTIHGNHRSHLFLAKAPDGTKVALKIPGSETRNDPEQLRRFVLEEWIARRLTNPHLLNAPPSLETPRTYLYSVTDYIEGQTLRQWMADNPEPSPEQVRDIVEQTVKGLRSFHRREMLHQDIRPENIMISADGVVKLIDFGAAYVAGVQEAAPVPEEAGILGTYQYTAPEYFSNEVVSFRSDMFSIGTIAYEMLTGHLPYGTQIARVRSPRDRAALRYRSAQGDTRAIAQWIDEALARAVHSDPYKRYETFSDFIRDLRRPSAAYQKRHARPLIERNPLKFWQGLTIALAVLSTVLAAQLMK
ncbi:MAG: bifunctional protein-serine/threonine kinase/phosphatase [Pseudoruegeria sp.]